VRIKFRGAVTMTTPPTSSVLASGVATRRAFGLLLLALSENKVFGTGPNGEEPTPRIGFGLSLPERKKVRAMYARAAIVLHYGGNDWSKAQTAGLQAGFAELGIETIAVTDAGFDPRKQVADIERVLSLRPEIIVSIPTDPVATAAAYKKAAAQGTKLVFMDNVPQGMKPGEDYVSVTSADNFGNGVVSAHLMAEALHGHGAVAMVAHEADFFVTRQRSDAFRRTIGEHYPQIEIVEEKGISGPDFAAEAEDIAAAMLCAHGGLAGIWAVWDVPAEGVMAAARKADRKDLVITTVDLGLNVALELARGGLVFGLGAQRPFDQGVAEAELAAYGLLGKTAPAYVALPALPVSKVSVLEAWKSVYHQPPPKELLEAAR
jgi:ribose transport system substrate-binding protein